LCRGSSISETQQCITSEETTRDREQDDTPNQDTATAANLHHLNVNEGEDQGNSSGNKNDGPSDVKISNSTSRSLRTSGVIACVCGSLGNTVAEELERLITDETQGLISEPLCARARLLVRFSTISNTNLHTIIDISINTCGSRGEGPGSILEILISRGLAANITLEIDTIESAERITVIVESLEKNDDRSNASADKEQEHKDISAASVELLEFQFGILLDFVLTGTHEAELYKRQNEEENENEVLCIHGKVGCNV